MIQNSEEIKVSVSLLTYNQEKFIAKAIESVLMQKVDFKYEIIIGDDCSSDGTREILQDYKNKYPNIIQLILHPRRYDEIPGRTNNTTNLYACRGKYIAMLDGDDYWISENKLQTQVDFLDTHDDYVLTFHDSLIVSENDDFTPYHHHEDFDFLDKDATFNHSDVAKGWFMQTSSLVFRNHLLGTFPEWFWTIYSADYALQLLVTQHGKIFYFKNLLSARLKNENSFTANVNQSYKDLEVRLKELELYKEHFEAVRNTDSNTMLAYIYHRHAFLLGKNRSFLKMSYYILKSIRAESKYAGIYLNILKKNILKKMGKVEEGA